MQHSKEFTSNLERTSCIANIMLTVMKLGFVHGGSNVTLMDYDDIHGSIEDHVNISILLQKCFADSLFEPTQSLRLV